MCSIAALRYLCSVLANPAHEMTRVDLCVSSGVGGSTSILPLDIVRAVDEGRVETISSYVRDRRAIFADTYHPAFLNRDGSRVDRANRSLGECRFFLRPYKDEDVRSLTDLAQHIRVRLDCQGGMPQWVRTSDLYLGIEAQSIIHPLSPSWVYLQEILAEKAAA